MTDGIKRKRGRPRGQGERGAATQAAILDAAELRFADYGYAATRLQDIADDVGKTLPAVLHFFRDKSSLHTIVIQRLLDDMTTALEGAAVGSSREESVIDGTLHRIEALIRFMRVRPALLGFILGEMVRARLSPPDENNWTHRTTRLARQYARTLIKQEDPVSENAVINVMNGTTLYYMINAQHLPDDDFERSVSAHLQTLRTTLNAVIEMPQETFADSRGSGEYRAK